MMCERTLVIGYHPDDIETMLGYETQEHADNTVALVASDGELTTINYSQDTQFCRSGRRRGESQRGLAKLGVPLKRQVYLGLPDGEGERLEPELTQQIVEVADVYAIGRLVTLGAEGYDQHTDHKAAHRAAVAAKRQLEAARHRPVPLFALDNQHTGEHTVFARGDTRRTKLAAMACHPSQFAISQPSGRTGLGAVKVDGHVIDPGFWSGFRVYHPLILRGETYSKM